MPLLFHFLCLFLLPVFQLTYTPKRTMAGVLLPILPCKKINTPTTQPLSMLSDKNCKPNKWIHFKAHPFPSVPSFSLLLIQFILLLLLLLPCHPHCLLCVYVCVRESSLLLHYPHHPPQGITIRQIVFHLFPALLDHSFQLRTLSPGLCSVPAILGGAAVPLTDL